MLAVGNCYYVAVCSEVEGASAPMWRGGAGALRLRCVKRPGDLDLLTLKVMSESRVTWATSVRFWSSQASVLELGPMYVTDRRQTHKSIA